MTDGPTFYQYKVLYRLKGSNTKQVQEDHVCLDLKELMDSMRKQGVSKDTVDFMYVHQRVVGQRGIDGMAEVVAIDNVLSPPKKDAPRGVVVEITKAKKDKPRIRLPTPPDPTSTTAKPKVVECMLYSAYPA